MSFEPAFLDLMTATMTVYPFESFDDYGEATYGSTGTTYRCYVEYKPKHLEDMTGEDIVAYMTAYVASTSILSSLSKYVLPDGSTGIVQAVHTNYDQDGVHHNVVYFGGGG